MENNLDNPTLPEQPLLTVSPAAIIFLREIKVWAKFFAILAFIFVGLMVIGAFTMGTIMSSISKAGSAASIGGVGFTALYLFIAVLYFLPALYLWRFTSNLGLALDTNDSEKLTIAFSWLKSHYKFIGVLMIIMLSLYAVILIGLGIGAAIG